MDFLTYMYIFHLFPFSSPYLSTFRLTLHCSSQLQFTCRSSNLRICVKICVLTCSLMYLSVHPLSILSYTLVANFGNTKMGITFVSSILSSHHSIHSPTPHLPTAEAPPILSTYLIFNPPVAYLPTNLPSYLPTHLSNPPPSPSDARRWHPPFFRRGANQIIAAKMFSVPARRSLPTPDPPGLIPPHLKTNLQNYI